jgi:hypothetical protein
MLSVRQTIAHSWMPQLKVLRASLGPPLGLGDTLSLTKLTQLLAVVEERHFDQNIDADAMHGKAHLVVRSDGSYEFSGYVRATGWPSFQYVLQAFLDAPGLRIAMQTEGRVFGTDTPGDRQREWSQKGVYGNLAAAWSMIRNTSQFSTSLNKELSGWSGGVIDVAKLAAEIFLAAETAGVAGVVIVIGVNVGGQSGVTIKNPNLLAGIVVSGAVLLTFGSAGLVPALIAGAATAALTNISFRRLTEQEIIFVDRVFRGTLPTDRIVLTNLYFPGQGFEREFTWPAIDGSIQVNMGSNFNNPLGVDVNIGIRNAYPAPGAVLIHELMHAWQIHHNTFLPGFICKAVLNRDYGTKDGLERSAEDRQPWTEFTVEEQASIIDQWFSTYAANLETTAALTDPRYAYVSNNVRIGQA